VLLHIFSQVGVNIQRVNYYNILSQQPYAGSRTMRYVRCIRPLHPLRPLRPLRPLHPLHPLHPLRPLLSHDAVHDLLQLRLQRHVLRQQLELVLGPAEVLPRLGYFEIRVSRKIVAEEAQGLHEERKLASEDELPQLWGGERAAHVLQVAFYDWAYRTVEGEKTQIWGREDR
jgi:hypothetical protein